MKISVIIVTYNGERWIEETIKNVLSSTIKVKLIVVDNKSTDRTIQILKGFSKNIILIKNDENLGFGAANNIGISHAINHNSDYIFLLNQDAYVEHNTIDKLVKTSIKYPDYGILSPIHLSPKKRFDKDFEQFVAPPFCKDFFSDIYFKRLNTEKPYEVKFVNAAAWFIHKDVIKKVGGFSPNFFHYGEDDNYCHRCIYHGYSIGVIANTHIIHDRTESKNTYFDGVKNVVRHHLVRWSNPLLDNDRYNSFMYLLLKFVYSLFSFDSKIIKINTQLLKIRIFNYRIIQRNIKISKSKIDYAFLEKNDK